MFFLSACSASRETPASSPRQQSTVEGQERSTLAEYEASFRPSNYDENVELAKKRASGITATTGNTARPDSTSVEEVTALGFRIQIFASANIYEANSAKLAAAGIITKDSLYVIYDPPVYKVRVGDYATRFDANRALPTIVELGYPDAWVVNDKIIKRKVTVIKRPGN